MRIEGYIYAPTEEPNRLSNAVIGATIRNDNRKPPWLAVNHDLDSVILTKWPGLLWRVAVINHGPMADLIWNAAYTRAVAVKILEEVPVDLLFGAHGKAVCSVIQAANKLTEEQAVGLAKTRHRDAAAIYAGSIKAKHSSLIKSGLSLINISVWKCARNLWGDQAFEYNEEREEWAILSPWSEAAEALTEAALALGAPDLVEDSDRQKLLKAWREVF